MASTKFSQVALVESILFVALRPSHEILIKFGKDFSTNILLVAKGISGKGQRATATQVPVFFNLEGDEP